MCNLTSYVKGMVWTEPTNIRTAGIDTNLATMFTLLLELNVVCGQRWIQFELQNSLSGTFAIDGKIHTTISQMCEIGSQLNFWHVHNNHIKTTKIFLVRSSPDPAKTFFSPVPVRSSPKVAILAFFKPKTTNLAFFESVWLANFLLAFLS